MKEKARISKTGAFVITFLCIILLAVILFVSPAKKLTYGIITDVFAKETKAQTEKRFDDIDKRMHDFEKQGLIIITESDRSKLPSLDYLIKINGEETSVTFSNTSDYCEIKIVCPKYVTTDKTVLCELYNEFAYYGTSIDDLIEYTQTISTDSKTAESEYFTASDKEYMCIGTDGLMLIGAVK